jgi:hypothetical protein
MLADPVLVLAWLVLAHVVGDFVLQNERMVSAKTDDGVRGLLGIVAHAAMVGLALIPVGFAFGAPGWTVVVLVTLTHGFVDRLKVILTRRAEADAIASAASRPGDTRAILGPAWTPMPGALFILDQLVHLGILVWAWAVFLSQAPLDPTFVDRIDGALAGRDLAVVHSVTLTAVVLLSLVIVNIRGGLFFVATLVHPREVVEGMEWPDDPGHATEQPARNWRVRIGPFEANVEADPPAAPEPGLPTPPPALPTQAPARVGATIGIIERLLIVALLLTNAEAAIGLVIAAKTIARFRLLDDRDFAEYYLLGTLASVSVALVTALMARAALGTLG